ncbi:MAG: FlgD immunoglobulin-like domain containing protein [Candidatus Eisenbacteria bacterium]
MSLADGPQHAGTHRTAWNGCDRNGRHLAAGTYFARLQVGSTLHVQ